MNLHFGFCGCIIGLGRAFENKCEIFRSFFNTKNSFNNPTWNNILQLKVINTQK